MIPHAGQSARPASTSAPHLGQVIGLEAFHHRVIEDTENKSSLCVLCVSAVKSYTNFDILPQMNMVRFSRLRAGLTQEELSKKAGISQPALARIEAGRVRPRIDTIERLLDACGMSLEAVPRAGDGIDRTTIRRMLRLTPQQRLQTATREARNLAALKPRRKR